MLKTLVAAAVLTAGFAPSGPALAQTPGPMPKGFALKVGFPNTTYETTVDGERVIAIRSKQSGAILRYPVDMPLERGTRLRWNWRVNGLPSDVAETTAATHDYTSIAIEFEDGRDLSWYWSAAVPVGQHFICPLPDWSTETHLVLHSGAKGLGNWTAEDRDVVADVARALPNPPRRIVAIWLINYTVPQKKQASTDVRSIRLVDARGREQVIFPQ